MGLDGGTIITRSDILRGSSWDVANADGGASTSTRGGQVGDSYVHKRRRIDPAVRKEDNALWRFCVFICHSPPPSETRSRVFTRGCAAPTLRSDARSSGRRARSRANPYAPRSCAARWEDFTIRQGARVKMRKWGGRRWWKPKNYRHNCVVPSFTSLQIYTCRRDRANQPATLRTGDSAGAHAGQERRVHVGGGDVRLR